VSGRACFGLFSPGAEPFRDLAVRDFLPFGDLFESFADGRQGATCPFGVRRDVVEADEVDVVAAAVLGDLEKVEDTEETGGASKVRGDVGEADLFDGVDFDFPFFHAVAAADADVGAGPDADAAGDFAAANAVAKAFGEDHGESLARR
jgi:hypothetical protein